MFILIVQDFKKMNKECLNMESIQQNPADKVGYLIYCPKEGELKGDMDDALDDELRLESEDGLIEDFDDGFIEDVKADIKLAAHSSKQDLNLNHAENSDQALILTHKFPTKGTLEDGERDLVQLEADVVVKIEPSGFELEDHFHSAQRESMIADLPQAEVPRQQEVGDQRQIQDESETRDASSALLSHGGINPQGIVKPDRTIANIFKTTKGNPGGKTYPCSLCDKTFTQSSNLLMHMRRHTGDKRYECSFCKKRFYTKNNLSIHERTHTGERPYSCSYCPKTFTQSSILYQHLTTHTGEKVHQCPICHKSFSQSGVLHRHMRIHSDGEKEYRCSVCCKQFSFEYNLSKHMVVHTGETPYKCSICSRRFSHCSSLRAHKKTHMNGKTNTAKQIDTSNTMNTLSSNQPNMPVE